jgi:hypothetical protein
LAALPIVSYNPTAPEKQISIHHESNLNEYDGVVHDSRDLSYSRYAALAGTRGGMRINIDDRTAIYGIKRYSVHTGTAYRFRHYVDPNGLSMPESAAVTFITKHSRSKPPLTRSARSGWPSG